MEMHEAKRVEIIIEAIMTKRLTDLLMDSGVTGFSVLPVKGGSGRSGHWTREGTIGRADGMSCVVCMIRPDRLDGLLEAVMPVLERHIGVVNVTDAHVMRAERF
ncbi:MULTISPECIES: P-II family nitrogen regulator [unclassified Roseovarius]|uniref:P-II family nitrogen regulator n=1 Tax=unclassified Roseovarius TaxID=2614913 RepID=UPI00273FE2F1|nr:MULTISPECIES: transcriptional regulator [unclassified Roseovarius]